MPVIAESGASIVIVDLMEFRRALVVHFLKDWAAAENVKLLSLQPIEAHQALREGLACKMIIFNAGVASCTRPETLAEIRVLRALAPSASLVVLADDEVAEDVVAVMQGGAEGYLSNHSDPALILHTLSFVLQGGTYFPRSAVTHSPFLDEAPLKRIPETLSAAAQAPAELEARSEKAGTNSPSGLPELTERQKAILGRLRLGWPNKMIGRELNLPESTVKVHVREIMRKLSVSNRTQVAVVVSSMGVVSQDNQSMDHNWPGGWLTGPSGLSD
jgi:DNA-binding NarL/FixJ family response regulator